MHSPLAPASPSPSLSFTPSRVAAEFTCLMQGLFVGVGKTPMSTSRATSRRGSEGEENQESSRLGLAGELPAHLRGARAVCEPAGAGAAPGASGSVFP